MPYRKQVGDLDLKIENLRLAIEAMRNGGMGRSEIDRALSELARVKAERLRLMLRQVNVSTERVSHQGAAAIAPNDRDPRGARLGDAD